jgi:hypothetical protein
MADLNPDQFVQDYGFMLHTYRQNLKKGGYTTDPQGRNEANKKQGTKSKYAQSTAGQYKTLGNTLRAGTLAGSAHDFWDISKPEPEPDMQGRWTGIPEQPAIKVPRAYAAMGRAIGKAKGMFGAPDKKVPNQGTRTNIKVRPRASRHAGNLAKNLQDAASA